MKIILLGKGESINMISKEIVLQHDSIAWANIHDHIKHCNTIPNKLDYLFIRQNCFVNDLTQEQKNAINELNIKHVLSTGTASGKVLNYMVEKQLSTKSPYGYNAATGLIAFNYLVDLKPDVLTICGLDLFIINKNLYYFDNVDDSLSSKQNNINLKLITVDGVLNDPNIHEQKLTIEFMKKKIITNLETKFIIYTLNEELKNNLMGIDNVEIK